MATFAALALFADVTSVPVKVPGVNFNIPAAAGTYTAEESGAMATPVWNPFDTVEPVGGAYVL